MCKTDPIVFLDDNVVLRDEKVISLKDKYS
jgi:hypothetical protein